MWYTISSESNGAPDGPKHVVRRFAQHYERGFDTRQEAEDWIAAQRGRIGVPDKR